MEESTRTEMDDKVEIDEKVKPEVYEFSCVINKNLLMLKLTLFFLYGATSSLVPYLTIHMQSIGLTMEQIALIYLALPFTTFLAPPITGYLVEKFGQYKPVLIISFILTAVLHHSIFLIPHQETPGVMPSGYIIIHPKIHFIDIWWSPCRSRGCPPTEELDIVLDMCLDHCLLKNITSQPNNMTGGPSGDPGNKNHMPFHVRKDGRWNFTLDMHEKLGDPIEELGIEMDSAEDDKDIMVIDKRFSKKLLTKYGVNFTELMDNDLRCGGSVDNIDNQTKTTLLSNSKDCILQKCQFRSGGPEVCPPDFKETDAQTFWTYFLLRFLGTIMMTGGVTIMDPIALAMIEKYGGDFGKERLFSSLGMALFSPVTGFMVDWISTGLGYTNYSAAFYMFDFLLIVSAITALCMPIGTNLPQDNIFRDLFNILKRPHLVIFILFMFILGNLWGFIESYLFFYLKDLKAPTWLLGFTVTVGTLSSLPFLYGAENITKKVGHVNIIIMAFFAHAARLAGYSFIESAWWCFPFEAMESLSVHLMWVSAATYCAVLAPKGLLATLIGVVGMAHFSIGRGSGSFVGGHVIHKLGIRQSFRLMASIGCISGIAYGVMYRFWLKNIDADDEKEEEDIIENGEADKLNQSEPKFKDQGTMVSFEKLETSRMSMVQEYNQIGSIISLGVPKGDIKRTLSISIRRDSYSGLLRNNKNSNSKNDLLKSAIEVSQKQSQIKNSTMHLNKLSTNSTSGKLYVTLSTPKLQQRSASLVTSDRDLGKAFIPNERDEIVYEEVKRRGSLPENKDQDP